MGHMVPSNREHGSEAFPLLRESCCGWVGTALGAACLHRGRAVCSTCLCFAFGVRHQAQVQTQAWSNPAEGHRAWLGGVGEKEQAELLWGAMSQLGLCALGAGGCAEAERGKRRWCLIFPSDSLKTCCSLRLVVPWHPPRGAGIGATPVQCKLEGEALLAPHPWRQRSLLHPSRTRESHLCLGSQCRDRDVSSKGLWCPPQPHTILCLPQHCLFSQPALL